MIQDQIENIIFDLGGVILNIDYHITINRFKEMGIRDFDQLYSQAQQLNLFDMFEKGQISEIEFVTKLQQHFHIETDDQTIIDSWNAMLLDFPVYRKETLEMFSKRFNIVLLSNTNETHVRAFKKIIMNTFGSYWFDEVFQNVYYSNEIGMRKPNKEVFEFVLNDNNFKAENTLFFDDSIQHIEGARNAGIEAVHLTNLTIEDYL